MMIRVAAAQFATGMDVAENLATVLRMIDQAAQVQPDVLVLPEFCNHASWYHDTDYAYQVAVPLDGEFLADVADRARHYGMMIMVNVTLQREYPRITGTNVLFGRGGEVLAVSDKQVLMGNENNFLSKATSVCPDIDLPFGRVGLYSCMDGVINETPRGLALRGARVLLNSLNSFALDEAALHVPVRAAENKVFVVAANKVGSLVPPELAETIAARVGIRADQLHGAGESQIVAPDGRVLAIAPKTGEAVIYADIDPSQADDKCRPDGTDIYTSRRPYLYAPLANQPHPREYQAGADEITTAVIQPDATAPLSELNMQICETIALGVKLIVLPELPFLTAPMVDSPEDAAFQTQAYVAGLRRILSGSDAVVALSGVQAMGDGWAHVGLLVSADGVILEQPQLHATASHPWVTALGDTLFTAQVGWGRVAILVGNDTIYPEAFRLAALQNVEVVACPTHLQEAWEAQTGLPERAAENRMAVVAASRPTAYGASLIAAVGEDFTLWTTWKNRPFDGQISYPILTYAPDAPSITVAPVYPACAGNRMVSQKTDLVDGRPWWLLDALVQ
jgi:predicted amidohydrolase